MKQILLILLLIAGNYTQSRAQSQEIEQLLLNVEKLAQLKQILTDMEKGYRIFHDGYNTVKSLSEGNFSLHKTFLDALMEVSPAVKKYHKIAEVINYQLALVREYKSAYTAFQNSGRFSGKELSHMHRVYENLIDQSLRNIEALTMVVTAGKTRMNDSERISAIDKIHGDMREKLDFLRHYNNSNAVLDVQRRKATKEVKTVQSIYGLNN